MFPGGLLLKKKTVTKKPATQQKAFENDRSKKKGAASGTSALWNPFGKGTSVQIVLNRGENCCEGPVTAVPPRRENQAIIGGNEIRKRAHSGVDHLKKKLVL